MADKRAVIGNVAIGWWLGWMAAVALTHWIAEPNARRETATLACNQHGYPHGKVDDQWRIVCWHDVKETVLGAK